MEKISSEYNLKFAYDSEIFQEIETIFSINEYSVEQFLELLESGYSIKSKNIEGTWVLILNESDQQAVITEENESLKSRSVIVTGYVKDLQTKENLLYCNVSSDENRGTMTNDLGFFSFEIAAKDSVRILVSHLGYKRKDTVVATSKISVIYLQSSDIMMDAIEVTQYEKQVLAMAPQPEKVGFNPVKSKNIPRVSNDDLANALLLIPGVNFFHGSSSGLSIRGSVPTDNLVLFDGIPVLETSHLLGNMSVLNSKYVQQAYISRGGFDAEFGGRVAGLIELTGKSGKNNKPYLDVSANLLNANVLANVPITNKFSVTAAWRRSFIDQWQNYLFYRLVEGVPADNTTNDVVSSAIYPTIQYQDLNAKLSFHPSDKIEFNLNVLYGSDYQSRDFGLFNTKEYYRNELMQSENKGVAFNWHWQMNNQWYHSITAGYSNLDKEIIDESGELEELTEVIENPGQGKGKGKGLLKTKEKTYERFAYDIDNGNNYIEEYRVSWKTEFKTGILRNQAGLGWSANSFTYDFYANRTHSEYPVDSIVNSAEQYLMNAFLQQYIQLTDELSFRWGIRMNVDFATRKTYWQPRGGIEFSPSREFKVHYSGGVYHQFLTGIKRFDSEGHFNPVWYLPGENGEGVVKSEHHIFGVKFNKDGWYINAEGYLKNSKGKLNLYAEPVNSGDDWEIAYIPHSSNERSKGIDLFIQKKHGILNHMVGYSLSKSEEQIEGILYEQWIPAYNDRLHRLKLTEMITWKNWTLTGSWDIASGLPVTNFTDENTLENNTRTDYFSQLDLALVKRFQTKHLSLNAGVSLLNVLNRKNIVEVDFLRFTSETESLTVRSDISALGFTPVFFIDFKIQ